MRLRQPRCNGIRAFHPSLCNFDTSSNFRMVPSGFDASNTRRPLKPVSRPIRLRQFPNSYILACSHINDLQCIVLSISGAAIRCTALRGLHELAKQREQHVGFPQIEVISGAVKVGRHQADGVKAMLLAERLFHLPSFVDPATLKFHFALTAHPHQQAIERNTLLNIAPQ